jgi:hypoxanthine phosphoribosyltransferase
MNRMNDGNNPGSEDIGEVILSSEQIQTRVAELAGQISRDYAGQELLLVGMLRGVIFFISDLMRRLSIPSQMDFIEIASYSAETKNRGPVRLVKDLEIPITDRHVLFVEDMIDTGLTLNYLVHNLSARRPASLEVCVLLSKGAHRLVENPVRYIGFELPDRYVVGYGLDFRERYRNLPFIGMLKPEAMKR